MDERFQIGRVELEHPEVSIASAITYHLANPETSEESTGHHHLLGHSCGLNDCADDEDGCSNGDWREYL
jgi:hypothetical protein